jgi:hypothetical protein
VTAITPTPPHRRNPEADEDITLIQTGADRPSGESPQPAVRHRRVPRWLLWVLASAAVFFIVLFIAADYAFHHAEPMLRARVVASLQERFRSPVQLDALHISVLNGLQVSGEGLRILNLEGRTPQTQGQPPMLSIRSFQFSTSVRQLLEPVMRLSEVRVQGMQLNIPPKDERGLKKNASSAAPASASPSAKSSAAT